MLRNFLKNRKAQNTAEYALLIALVVAGVIAMQTYAQRALQARIHAAAAYMAGAASVDSSGNQVLNNMTQYEPYYLQSNYSSVTNTDENKRLGVGMEAADSTTNNYRNGMQEATWTNTADENL
jgi:Flp pilus assembly pilin Flp